MKKLLFLIAVFVPIILLSQANDLKLISISGQYNANLWLPLDNASKTFIDNGGKIKVNTWKTSIGISLYRKRNYPIRMGVTYFKASHLVEDRIKIIKYSNSYTNYETKTYIFNDPMDLKSTSHSIGVFAEPMWKLVRAKKSVGLIGLNASVYLLEIYNSYYITTVYINSTQELSAIKPHIKKKEVMA